eukprot:TRINITY_DN29123_c0_g1_i1.p1 TRINITY_DN29123_c0_g1~~TRINITY_DN29123_c0_g1_i1.p1  ORF type:complete len:245 (-),score=60.11 TRINITY_DN29123_c0_g1_i1:490-1224(-)
MAGPQCCEGAPSKDQPNLGIGTLEQWQHLQVYVTGSVDSKKAVILVSDIFGFDKPNLRKLADKVAAAGYFVAVPDYLYGDPYIVKDPSNPFADFPEWIKNHGADKAVLDSKTVIEEIKKKGITVIGAGGFCWGAKVVVGLLNGEELKAGVLLHPSFVTVDDIKEVNAPIAILGAEIDQTTPPELVKKFEEILSSKPEVESFVTIYPGVAHGWTVRYDANDEAAVKRAEEAHAKMLEWFAKYLSV